MIECPEKIKIKSDAGYDVKPTSEKTAIPALVHYGSKHRELKFARNEKLRERFNKLSQIWHEEMDGVSSIQVKTAHWAYQEVIGLGEPVVPCILDELVEHKEGGWFFALAKILKHNPVRPEHKMDMDQVLEDWLTYARELRLDF